MTATRVNIQDEPRLTPTESSQVKNLVERSYDKVAQEYLAWSAPRPTTTRASYIDHLVSILPAGASVLELGCGAGVPSTQTLLSHGLQVTGVDISASQIALAREHIPQAQLIQSDMMSLSFPESSYDAIVGFYSIFHLPKEEQGIMISRATEWLKPGGWLLCNFHTADGDTVRENWFKPGVSIFSSGLGVEGNREMLRKDGKGLKIVKDEVAVEKVGKFEETFHWILAIRENADRAGSLI